jgi:hypothetical protein
MNGKTILALALAATLVAGSAAAQTKPKLYRWVDKEGKVHYDDALPPEAVNQARKEFSAKSGATVGEVDRALTVEERTQQAAAAAAAAEAAAKAEEQHHQEEVMLATYGNENDLRRAYGERVSLLKTTLESTDVSIKNVRENLALMLKQASEAELAGHKVPDDRLATIRDLHAESTKQQQFQVKRRGELEELNAEFARMLARYRELKGAPVAPANPAAALPNATPAPGGG